MNDDTAVKLIDILTEISWDLKRMADVLESNGRENATTSSDSTVTAMPVKARPQIKIPAPKGTGRRKTTFTVR